MSEQESKENPNDAFDAKYKGMATLDIVRAMDQIQKDKEAADEAAKEIGKEFDYLRLKLVPARFEEEGIENLKVEGIGRVSLTGDMHVSILAANRDAAYDYFRDIGKGSLITESINSSTLKAAVKAMIKGGEEVPEALIKVTPFTRASITKR